MATSRHGADIVIVRLRHSSRLAYRQRGPRSSSSSLAMRRVSFPASSLATVQASQGFLVQRLTGRGRR